MTTALIFEENESLGAVSGVDTRRVVVDVQNPSLLTRIGIGALIAIQGATEQEFLISLVERVTRILDDGLTGWRTDLSEETVLEPVPKDSLRAVLVGTYRTVDGRKFNTFKRGADSFPQIDRRCFVIEGGNLQRFMGLLGADIPENERLRLGTFVSDRNAAAIISGDKFFQRHAAILGSTGSGKSWAVALLLEKAA